MRQELQARPRIEAFEVTNYRALKSVQLKNLTPLSVFLGPNGSGKSTLFDVFAFLSECFTDGLRKALDRRGRFKELRTRGEDGPISFVIKYKENSPLRKKTNPVITYKLTINEGDDGPFIEEESVAWRRGSRGKPFNFLLVRSGKGQIISGDEPEKDAKRTKIELVDKDILAVNTYGQIKEHPRVAALRRFITDWYLSYLSADSARATPDSGPQEHLSKTGDNLPNVIQYLSERYEDVLEQILRKLAARIPQLESVTHQQMEDGRLLLLIKDAPFSAPILSKYASDGTLKMLAYLTVLYDPDTPQLIGIEEPENHLHPRLLPGLCEECRNASSKSQLFISTHSPFFVNGLRPDELWVLYRDTNGFTNAIRASDMYRVPDLFHSGGLLGDLWYEGFFDVGDPLTSNGGPRRQSELN